MESIPPNEMIQLENLIGSFPYVSAAPTWTPKTFQQSLAIYKNGATLRLYIYDVNNATWRFSVLS